MRPPARNIKKTSKLVVFFNGLLEANDTNQVALAAALGYERANLITMFKQGLTPIPLNKIPAIAKFLGADPAHMMRLALEDREPEILEAIGNSVGLLLSDNEKHLISFIRDQSDSTNPKFDAGFLKDLGALMKKHGLNG